jgi:TonB family protein
MRVELPVPPPDLPARRSPDANADEGKVFVCRDQKEPVADDAASTAEAKTEEAFSSADVTTKAVITSNPHPRYTEEARWNATSGRVRLRLLLASTGRVSKVTVLRGLPDGLTPNAVAAACKVQFTPASKDGQTVSQYLTLEYGFHLDDYRPLFIRRRPPTFYSSSDNFVSDNFTTDNFAAGSFAVGNFIADNFDADDSALSFNFPSCRLPRLRLR